MMGDRIAYDEIWDETAEELVSLPSSGDKSNTFEDCENRDCLIFPMSVADLRYERPKPLQVRIFIHEFKRLCTHTRLVGPGTLSHGPNSMSVPADSMNEGPDSNREDQLSTTETKLRKWLSTNTPT